MATRAKLDIFAFRDSRAFLRAYAERARSERKGFSAAAFTRKVGLRSPNYLGLVINGKRRLTEDLARRFGETCGLRDDSLDYFCALVAFNQARTATERAAHYVKLQGFRRFREAHRLDAAQSAYHSEWFIPTIFELCASESFQDDPAWIAAQLVPSITIQQAKQALAVLLRIGLLKRDAAGHLVQATSIIETPQGPLGHQVAQYHRVMMQRASEAIDRVPRDEREIASLTMCISDDRLDEVKAELQAVQRRLVERFQSDARPQRVVQVNFQMFPLSKKQKKE